MKTCYKCEKCGLTFEDYEKAQEHENNHYEPVNWMNDEAMDVSRRETEWEKELYAPSAVVVPMDRTIYNGTEWVTERIYVKYYYSAKRAAEQVFSIDHSVIG